jgi:pimeloyl-ACP methyl ester carboxylesterase
MNTVTKNIYCVTGLGADEKAFGRLKINGYSLQCLKCLPPLKNENLFFYAKRMLMQIEEKSPIILGLSFGGMIAIEMAKQMEIGKLILISTVKTSNEIPRWMRLSGAFKLHKILPIKTNRFTEKADDRRLGIETAEEKLLVDSYRKNADQEYINWAVAQILTWKNQWLPKNFFHIHGEKDRMFPVKNVNPTHIIKNGTHIMIVNKADEISICIEQILSNSS